MTAEEVLALIKASEKRFYCYILSRPDGRPFYVGSGKGKRVFAHEFDARRGYRGHKQSLIRRILKDGEGIDYSITEFFEMREDASAEECRLIALYGRADIGTGGTTPA